MIKCHQCDSKPKTRTKFRISSGRTKQFPSDTIMEISNHFTLISIKRSPGHTKWGRTMEYLPAALDHSRGSHYTKRRKRWTNLYSVTIWKLHINLLFVFLILTIRHSKFLNSVKWENIQNHLHSSCSFFWKENRLNFTL
jgi:hypothetical protein